MSENKGKGRVPSGWRNTSSQALSDETKEEQKLSFTKILSYWDDFWMENNHLGDNRKTKPIKSKL